MNKKIYLLVVSLLTFVFACSMSVFALTGTWKQDQDFEWHCFDRDGQAYTDEIMERDGMKFYLNEDGYVAKDYLLEDRDGKTYYFNWFGAMTTDAWVKVDSSVVENTDDYVPEYYWYYFESNGKAVQGSSGKPKKYTLNGKKYMFNEYGQLLTGWISEDGKTVDPDDNDNPFEDAMYYAGDDGELKGGWVTYLEGYDTDEDYLRDKSVLYFYFNPTSFKKTGDGADVTKKINGKTYAFNQEGVMLSKWDVTDHTDLFSKATYFSGDDDGHQVKKGWVYDVPSEKIDTEAYNDDEDKYMYFDNSGTIVRDTIKKINNKYYAFSDNGIMKTGFIVWKPTGTNTDTDPKFVAACEDDYFSGEDITKKGKIWVDDDAWIKIDWSGRVLSYQQGSDTLFPGLKMKGDATNPEGDKIEIHYFGANGDRITGTHKYTLSDADWTFDSTNSGNRASGVKSKKYYAQGFLLTAVDDLRYGIYVDDSTKAYSEQKTDYTQNLLDHKYLVLDTSGKKVKGAKKAKKDGDDNYWFIDQSTGTLVGIWTKDIKEASANFVFKQTPIPGAYLIGTDRDDLIAYLSGNVYGPAAITDYVKDHPEIYVLTTPSNIKADFTTYYITLKYNGLWFKSDYDDKEQFIPFGVKDAAGCTCFEEYDTGSYCVEPGNDHFLNCFWTE